MQSLFFCCNWSQFLVASEVDLLSRFSSASPHIPSSPAISSRCTTGLGTSNTRCYLENDDGFVCTVRGPFENFRIFFDIPP